LIQIFFGKIIRKKIRIAVCIDTVIAICNITVISAPDIIKLEDEEHK